jgi:prepilin-type N-terminal cleavage/methylation domain-containing protein
MHTTKPFSRPAFTIVELLIVIVVIAILASLAIVAYTNIQRRAREVAVKADLANIAKQVGMENAEDGSYPANHPPLPSGSPTNLIYDQLGGGTGFCLTAYNPAIPDVVFHVSNTVGITSGPCTGHVIPGGGQPQVPSTMSDLTQNYCSTMTTYTGSNPSAILSLHDPRGTGQDYEVAKLADGRCWMIENLRLGSTSGTIALTPTDTNITSNWTLPQVTTSPTTLYNQPVVMGGVPGDNGTGQPGQSNYGYLYNWCAATAGGTASGGANTCTASGIQPSNATGDICAAGWSMPSGGYMLGEYSALDVAFGGTGDGVFNGGGPLVDVWDYSGAFKTVLSGDWSYGSYSAQGASGELWTSSTHIIDVDTAAAFSFITNTNFFGSVDPSNLSGIRYFGYGVRCVLK